MRRLLILALALLLGWILPSVSLAQMAAVSSNNSGNPSNLFAGTNTYSYSFGGNTVASGNLVVMFVGSTIRTVSSISGTNLTMAELGTTASNAADFKGDLWYGISTGSVSSVTITISGASGDDACVGYVELSGESSDQSGATANGSANDNVTTHNSGSVTPPTANNTVVAGAMRTSATWTEDGAFTMVSGADAGCMFGYLTQTAATAQEFNSSSDINRYSVVRIGAMAGTAGGGGAPGGSSGTLNMFPRRLQVNP